MATAKDIIQRGKVAVRNSATLYPLYQEFFKEAFGYYPECPTCGSVLGHKHWDAFVSFVNGADPKSLLTTKTETMSNNTFKIKDRNKLYSFNFKKKDQERLFTSRTYGDVMTEEFAVGYLDSAGENEELLNQRKAEFTLLPKAYRDEPAEDEAEDLSKLKLAELQAIATEKAYPSEEWEKIKSKADFIAYLDAKEIGAEDDLL